MLRNTKQRQLIMELMVDNHTHPTADQLYDMARKIDPHISRGTVYRNLNTLSKSGELYHITMPSGPDRFDIRTDNHYHFICNNCSSMIDLSLPYRAELNTQSQGMDGYKVENHRLILEGLCPNCND